MQREARARSRSPIARAKIHRHSGALPQPHQGDSSPPEPRKARMDTSALVPTRTSVQSFFTSTLDAIHTCPRKSLPFCSPFRRRFPRRQMHHTTSRRKKSELKVNSFGGRRQAKGRQGGRNQWWRLGQCHESTGKSGFRGVCLVLYCSPLDKAAIFGVERLPRIGV